MNEPVIVCSNVAKTYADGRVRVDVLKGVDLQIERGEGVAIVGASGAGKSTLLHILGGLDRVSDGEVRVAGNSLRGMSQKALGQLRNRHLGFIYQFHHLLPEFSAVENVAMPLLIAGTPRDQARASAVALLERVGLAERLDHKPGQLSGGERQRAAVARALVTRPDCVLADEPTGNLDEDNAAQVYRMMLELNREFGTSLVIVTHDQGLAAQLDRRLSLHGGQLHPV